MFLHNQNPIFEQLSHECLLNKLQLHHLCPRPLQSLIARSLYLSWCLCSSQLRFGRLHFSSLYFRKQPVSQIESCIQPISRCHLVWHYIYDYWRRKPHHKPRLGDGGARRTYAGFGRAARKEVRQIDTISCQESHSILFLFLFHTKLLTFVARATNLDVQYVAMFFSIRAYHLVNSCLKTRQNLANRLEHIKNLCAVCGTTPNRHSPFASPSIASNPWTSKPTQP